MLRSYLVLTLRSLLRNRLNGVVSLVGLTTGLAGCILTLIYVQFETGYDQFHPHPDRLFRLVSGASAKQPVPLAPLLAAELPEVTATVRVTPAGMFRPLLTVGDRQFYETVHLADEGFFELFGFRFIHGDRRTALTQPHSMVLSSETARRYFGEANPLGKVVRWDNSHDYRVTGVYELPPDTHFPLHVMVSMCTARAEPLLGNVDLDSWDYEPFYTYLLLSQGADAASIGRKVLDVVERHTGREYRAAMKQNGMLRLQPVPDIHLQSHFLDELQTNGEASQVRLITAAGMLLLLVACVNFGTLTAARVTTRSREVGVRRAAGATRGLLAGQILGESCLLAMGCTLLALALAESLLPAFSALAGKPFRLDMVGSFRMLMQLLGLVAVVGLVGGGPPALAFAAMDPAQVLKGMLVRGTRGVALRRMLVGLQFGLSIALGIAALVVNQQLDFVRRRNLGFDREQVLVFRTGYPGVQEKAATVRAVFRQVPGVVGVSAFHYIPSGRYDDWCFGEVKRPERSETLRCAIMTVDAHFTKVFGLELVAGRDLMADCSVDRTNAVLLNETAVRQLGYDSPRAAVGQLVRVWGSHIPVVGVVRDFHFESLHHAVEPAVLRLPDDEAFYVATAVRIQREGVSGTLQALEKAWRRIVPFYPMGFWFLDESYSHLYRAEESFGQMLKMLAVLGMGVAALGAFSLAAFNAARRGREVAVRKVLGASVGGLVVRLCAELTLVVLVASVLATPVAVAATWSWLEGFAYRAKLGPGAPAVAILGVLAVTWMAVGWQALRAALANPVDALRQE